MSTPHAKAEHQQGRSHPCLLMRLHLLHRHLYSPNINPCTCTFPMHTCTQHSRDNKGWTNTTNTTLIICTETSNALYFSPSNFYNIISSCSWIITQSPLTKGMFTSSSPASKHQCRQACRHAGTSWTSCIITTTKIDHVSNHSQLHQVTPGFVLENPPSRPPAYEFEQTMPSIPMMPTNQGQYIYVPNLQITPSPVQQLMQQQNVSWHDVLESCPSQTQTSVPKSTPFPKSTVHSIDIESDSKKMPLLLL